MVYTYFGLPKEIIVKNGQSTKTSLFQAYKFAMHFRTLRCDVTDYASV